MWNLDSLYKSSCSDSFNVDMKRIKSIAEQIQSSSSKDEQNELFNDFYTVFNRTMSYCNLRNMDTNENSYDKQTIRASLSILRNIYQSVNSIVNEDSISISTLKPSSDLFTDFYYSSLKEYRKSSNENPLATYKYSADILTRNAAHSLIGVKTNVLKLAELEGYDSPLDKALELYQITEKTFNNMIQSIEKLIPKFQNYFKNIPYSEIHAHRSLKKADNSKSSISIRKLGYPDLYFSLENAICIIKESFAKFSDESAKIAETAFAKGWINTEPILTDPLCVNIPSVSEFRIKVDYKEDLASLISLAHELGHGYHGYTLFNDDILSFNYPLSVGESSALFFEDLVYDELRTNGISIYTYNSVIQNLYSNADSQSEPTELLNQMLEDQYISNLALFTIDVYARYLFEKRVYESIKSEHVDGNKLNQIMRNCLVYVYGDIPELNQSLWIEKSHFYNFSRPYYNIPYIFGIFIEKTLYIMYKNRLCEDFPKQYKSFFSNTNTLSIRDNMLASFNIDVEDPAHWDTFINNIIGYL